MKYKKKLDNLAKRQVAWEKLKNSRGMTKPGSQKK
jgi:hypothetical protein